MRVTAIHPGGRHALVLAAPLLAAVLLLAACEVPGEEPRAPLSERLGDGDEVIEVRLVGYQIGMPTSIPAGETTFRIRNEGQRVHGFEVEGQGIEREVARIEPGHAATLTVDLPPGRYRIYCPVADHAEKGMQMPLYVTDGEG